VPPPTEQNLAPIITRLQEIHRKCGAMSARNDEAADMTKRLDEIIEQLKAGGAEDGEPPAFREISRRLFPVARMFESLGFMSIAREVSYVERALEKLDPSPADSSTPAEPQVGSPYGSSADASPQELERTASDDEASPAESTRGSRIPAPVGIVLIVFLLAILASIFVVRENRERVQKSLAARVPTATAVPQPTPELQPTPPEGSSSAEWQIESEPEPASRAHIAEEISSARLALADGDLNVAISHVSAAARYDKTHSLVIETARSIMNELVARGDSAADSGEWEVADQYIDYAKQIATRFGLPDEDVVHASRRHHSMVRFLKIAPDDVTAINASAGRRTIVYFKNGSTREGTIRGATGRTLELDQASQIDDRGGKLYYTDEIALELVSEIRVFDE